MKPVTKWLAGVLAGVLMLSLLPVGALAAQTQEVTLEVGESVLFANSAAPTSADSGKVTAQTVPLGQRGTTASFEGALTELDSALWTAAAGSEANTLILTRTINGTQVYIHPQNGSNQHPLAGSGNVLVEASSRVSGSYYIVGADNNNCLYFSDALRWDKGYFDNRGNVSDNHYCFYFLEEGEESDPILPGYKKAASVTAGRQYLIVGAVPKNGVYYALYPVIHDNSAGDYAMTVKLLPRGLKLTAVAASDTPVAVTAGDVTYNVHVTSSDCTLHSCEFTLEGTTISVLFSDYAPMTVAQFLQGLTKAPAASWKVIGAEGELTQAGLGEDTPLEDGMRLVITANDGVHQSVFTIRQQTRMEIGTTVLHTETDSAQKNYFTFSGNNTWSAGNANHVWSGTPDAAHPDNTWYTVDFVGHKVDIYAGKNAPMGIVEYFMDGERVGEFDLYQSGNIDSTYITTIGGLEEGPHQFKAVATGRKNASASNTLIDCAQVVVYSWRELGAPIFGTVVSDQLQYISTDFDAAVNGTVTEKTLHAWKNDAAVSQILLGAGGNLTGVTVTPGDFTDEKGHTLAASNVTATFVKSVQAYSGGYPGYGNPDRAVPQGSRAEASEVLWSSAPMELAAGKAQSVWVNIAVPKNTPAGTYIGTLTVTADGLKPADVLTFTYTLQVADLTLPDAAQFAESFDIELWQNPYASAYYYGDITPFSPQHLAILTPIMEKYKAIGGHAVTASIVEEAWAGQTYLGDKSIKFPSMIKWSKNASDQWVFDYTDFDKWVQFNLDLGLGDKIVCYSVAPWGNTIRYTGSDGTQQTIPSSNSAAWNAAWNAMLTDLMAHAEEKGWKERIYIGIDERGISDAALALVEAVKGTDNKSFKIATAMDHFADSAKQALLPRIHDWTVGSTAVKGNQALFQTLLAQRNQLGLKTTVYTCTEHYPSSFSLSAPGESYWTMLYSYAVGAQGYLRWAYDSWVEDPLRDTTHNAFEPGDCFLVFPDEKDAPAPQVYSSLRLEKMAEGVRDVNKLILLKELAPAMGPSIDAALSGLKTATAGKYEKRSGAGQNGYLSDAGKAALASDMDTLKAAIAALTEEYFERVENLDTKLITDPYPTNPLVVLPEEYQGNVEGPYYPSTYVKGQPASTWGTRHARQYIAHPDMIQLDSGRLIATMSVGHGHGPVVMKYSDDLGETWTEKTDIPSSWAGSQETPTLFRLDFRDGSQKLLLVCARPYWDASSVSGGWDASVSDDQGETWTQFQRFHETLPGGGQNWSIVGMASLVHLKDEKGNFIDKWMGVYHNADFVNYKTYLTFDQNGNMQWSTPEPYLPQYRSFENKYHICEVGMFRSPDGQRIVAMARADVKPNRSLIFWSDDEGETWSKPLEMQPDLQGERHKAVYDPISNRVIVFFREIILDNNKDGTIGDWMAGDWVAWVGTYDQLIQREPGEYRILLDEDWAMNTYSGDTGYTGVTVQPDGTIIAITYGHWDKDFSAAYSPYNVRTDLCWIRQAKFKLSDLDEMADRLRALGPQDAADEPDGTVELDSAVLAANAWANSWTSSSSTTDGPAAWAFDDQERWWHSNYGTATDENIRGVPSESSPIWIATGFGKAEEIAQISYQARSGNGCVIDGYEIQTAHMSDPAARPGDSDFHTVASGHFENNHSPQTVVLDTPVTATHIRIRTNTAVQGGNQYPTAKRIRVYAVDHTPPPAPDTTAPAAPTALQVGSVTGSGAALSWTPPADEDVVCYQVYLDEGAAPAATAWGRVSLSLTNLEPGHDYTVRVYAQDAAGNRSAACATANFSTPAFSAGGVEVCKGLDFVPGRLYSVEVVNADAENTPCTALAAYFDEEGLLMHVELTPLTQVRQYVAVLSNADVAHVKFFVLQSSGWVPYTPAMDLFT